MLIASTATGTTSPTSSTDRRRWWSGRGFVRAEARLSGHRVRSRRRGSRRRWRGRCPCRRGRARGSSYHRGLQVGERLAGGQHVQPGTRGDAGREQEPDPGPRRDEAVRKHFDQREEHEQRGEAGSGQRRAERAEGDLDTGDLHNLQGENREQEQPDKDAPAVPHRNADRERADRDLLPVEERVDQQENPGSDDHLRAERELGEIHCTSLPRMESGEAASKSCHLSARMTSRGLLEAAPLVVLAWPTMTDPVSWLQIEQGWNVVSADGVVIGTVAQVEGDKHSDIFDGLAVASTQPTQIRYVPGEQVGAIYPGEVTLKIASADTGTLEPFQTPPPQTKFLPGKAPLATRMSKWLRGK